MNEPDVPEPQIARALVAHGGDMAQGGRPSDQHTGGQRATRDAGSSAAQERASTVIACHRG